MNRLNPLAQLRRFARDRFFQVLRRALAADEGKRVATESLGNLLRRRPADVEGLADVASPYPDLGRPREASVAAARDDVVFITARFRSGSTLLWNLFRHVPRCTAYYEPLNERRWFDPSCRGAAVDPTHREVSDYWREYEGLACLAPYFRDEWTERNLSMDSEVWAPDLKRYIELLIEHAPGRPVLQFNRVDFRLPWLRRHFPGARIVHLYRHPRDQWCSTLGDVRRFPPQGTVAEFPPHDRFYLLPWCRDLKYQFPFLDERSATNPYELFYFIWKLSYLYGVRYADHSLSFESLVADPAARIGELLGQLDLDSELAPDLAPLVSAPAVGRWRHYAGEGWFRDIEMRCEEVLHQFLGGAASANRAARPGAMTLNLAS